jgi:phosphatidylethanolamine/phosphatidyl-N-methylethanolamine N-methyltransferase
LSAQRRQAKLNSDPKNLVDLRLSDEARFIRSWLENPLLAGAIAPSGRFLARAMAQCVDPSASGPIVELGPGTGPVTQALLARGIAADRLTLVEFEPSFCKLLKQKFPHVKVVQGDAYRLSQTLGNVVDAPPAAIVSSLPLLTKPDHARLSLLHQAFELMGPEGQFIQFTYGVKSPIPNQLAARNHFTTQSLAPIWLNLPPARIFIYRHVDGAHRAEPKPDVFDKLLRQSRRFGREIRDELEEARARFVVKSVSKSISKSRPS